MTHWGWYWKYKKGWYKPKRLCENFWLCEINSFDMFKNKELIQLVRNSPDRISLQVPRYNLTATLMENDSLYVVYNKGSYVIPVERKPCNYGGFYHFFHCPQCDARMRKLYCIDGVYLCRKCAHLGYYSQRLHPSRRYAQMSYKVVNYLKSWGGSLEQKPPMMTQYAFQKLRRKYVKYDEKSFYASHKELESWYGPGILANTDDSYSLLMPSNLYDAYDYKDPEK